MLKVGFSIANINQVIEMYWFTNWTDNSQSLNMFLFHFFDKTLSL